LGDFPYICFVDLLLYSIKVMRIHNPDPGRGAKKENLELQYRYFANLINSPFFSLTGLKLSRLKYGTEFFYTPFRPQFHAVYDFLKNVNFKPLKG
jgi:hypothetical protein